MQEPSCSATKDAPSYELQVEHVEETNDEMKSILTNALKYCESLFESENMLINTPPNKISSGSVAMGEEIFKEVLCMLEERNLITDEDLITFEECDSEGEYEEVCYVFFIDILY